MRFIGITGGVGAGKSELLKYLTTREDTRVMLADEIAKELSEPKGSCYPKLRKLFSSEQVFAQDGRIDRAKMAEVIFADQTKRAAMNAVIHPAVKSYVQEECAAERERGRLKYLFLEAALLIEEHYDEICDELWYIYTSKENRKKRLKASRGYSDEKIEAIFASQLAEEGYRDACQYEIDNNGTTEETIAQVLKILNSEGEDTNGVYRKSCR